MLRLMHPLSFINILLMNRWRPASVLDFKEMSPYFTCTAPNHEPHNKDAFYVKYSQICFELYR